MLGKYCLVKYNKRDEQQIRMEFKFIAIVFSSVLLFFVSHTLFRNTKHLFDLFSDCLLILQLFGLHSDWGSSADRHSLYLNAFHHMLGHLFRAVVIANADVRRYTQTQTTWLWLTRLSRRSRKSGSNKRTKRRKASWGASNINMLN